MVLVAAAVGLAGCTPGPAPKPTPTPLFTSEAEAFKAAEQVYRDYTDAGNAGRNGSSSADPQKYLAGSALDDDIKSRRELKDAGLKVTGNLVVRSFSGKDYDQESDSVSAVVCVGASDTRVTNENGADVTPADRPSVSAVAVSFARAGKGAGLVIIKSEGSAEPCSPATP